MSNDVSPTITYYVYRIMVKPSGLFYIGITNTLARRKAYHLKSIKGMVFSLRFQRETKVLEGGLPFHHKMARDIVKGVRFNKIHKTLVDERCEFRVLCKRYSVKEAMATEQEYFDKYKDDPRFINDRHYSSHPHNRIKNAQEENC